MVLVTGCSTLEHGNIADPEPVEVYYYKTTYVQQPFAVLLATEMDDGTVRVVFSTDAEVNFEGGFYSPDIEPNHLLVKNYKKEEYANQIGGLPIFEASFNAYTFVFPEEGDAKYCTVLTESDDLETAIREAQKMKGDRFELNEDYLKKWKFIYYKL